MKKDWLRQNRQKLVLVLLGIAAGILFLYWSSQNVFGSRNMEFRQAAWEKSSACGSCAGQCTADIMFSVEFIDYDYMYMYGKGKELQCKLFLDGIDLYRDKGNYYCGPAKSLDTTVSADPRQDHNITVCCSADGLDFKLDQDGKPDGEAACKTRLIQKLCTGIA
jgi:hypothetical protein